MLIQKQYAIQKRSGKDFFIIFCIFSADYIQPLICKASDPEYEKCIWNSFEKSRPYLMKGIPEVSMPPMDPFVLPLMTVNRTLNDVVSINAICKNIKVEGARNIIIEGLK